MLIRPALALLMLALAAWLGGAWAPAPVRAESPRIYVVAKAVDPALGPEALQVAALARAALLDAPGFDWQSADALVRGEQLAARAAQSRARARLRRGRQAYLSLEFDSARRALEQSLVDWEAAQAVLDSPEPVAETLMYLGAALVLSEQRAEAARVFTRYHVQFSAVAPNPDLFNPAIMQEWQAAGLALGQRAQGSVEVQVQPGSVVISLDGLPRGSGSLRLDRLAPGTHWLRGAGLGAEGRVLDASVESGRVTQVNLGPLTDSAALLDLFEHASRSEGAQALAQQLGVSALAVIEVRRGVGPGELELTLRSFDGRSGRKQVELSRNLASDLVERSRGVRGLVAAWLDGVPRTAGGGAPALATGPRTAPERANTPASAPGPSERREDAEARPAWYRRWWVWALVGGAVAAGGVTAGVLLSRDHGGSAAPNHDDSSVTLEF
jgi:hypothetical protein